MTARSEPADPCEPAGRHGAPASVRHAHVLARGTDAGARRSSPARDRAERHHTHDTPTPPREDRREGLPAERPLPSQLAPARRQAAPPRVLAFRRGAREPAGRVARRPHQVPSGRSSRTTCGSRGTRRPCGRTRSSSASAAPRRSSTIDCRARRVRKRRADLRPPADAIYSLGHTSGANRRDRAGSPCTAASDPPVRRRSSRVQPSNRVRASPAHALRQPPVRSHEAPRVVQARPGRVNTRSERANDRATSERALRPTTIRTSGVPGMRGSLHHRSC